ncbi:MAG: TfoX/Sxy family protein [Inquilinus sp.]|nr:TfoX/Sxy family protein [Inquilinus sp.]
MPNSPAFIAQLVGRLVPLGPVAARAMFGGHGLYIDDRMFALVANDVLFLKVDDGNRERFAAAGMQPFRPSAERPMTMSYYPVPAAVFEEPDALLDWADSALQAARRQKRPARKRGRRSPG